MKGHKIRLLAILLLFGILLCGCNVRNYIYTEDSLKKVAEKSLKKKYGEEFVVHSAWAKNAEVFYADCSPKDNSEIVFRADVYKNGKGVEADSYKQTILAGEINRILKPYFEEVFGDCYTRAELGMSYQGERKIQEDQPIDIQLQEYLQKYSNYIACDVYVKMYDASESDIEAEYEFLTSTLVEKIQSDICSGIVPSHFTVMLHFGDEEMLKNSEAYFQTSTQVMGEFDSELRKYGEIICQYKDGTIYNIDYEEYEKRRLRYEDLRKRNN